MTTSETSRVTPRLPATPPPPPGWRAYPWGRLMLAVVALGGVCVMALWVWAAGEGSLATTLRLVCALLPSSQSLSVQSVKGSLRHGGHIGQWTYTQQGLLVQAEQTTLSLDATQLWHGYLPLNRVQIQQLKINDQRAPTPLKPPASLTLPLRAQLDWQVDQLTWQGAPAFEVMALMGHYAYDGQQHVLKWAPFDFAHGRYSGNATLQAAQPMALQVNIHGTIQAPQPKGARPFPVTAQLSLQGELGAPDALLNLTAQLEPPPTPSNTAQHMPVMQAQVSAKIQPWHAQPVVRAQGSWAQLDLASVWPGAPVTSLQGQLAVTPIAQGWQMDVGLRNQTSGPWDRQQLPLSTLNSQLLHLNGLWQIKTLKATLKEGTLQGQAQETSQGWTGQLQLNKVQPGQLHTALLGPALSGQIEANTLAQGGLDLAVDVTGQGAVPGMKLRPAPGMTAAEFLFKGQWHAGAIDIQRLALRWLDAELTGQGRVQWAQRAGQGAFVLGWPGAQMKLQGQLAADKGQGQVAMAVTDLTRSLAWAQRWPGLAGALKGWQAAGQAQLAAQWTGGWKHKDTRWVVDWQAPNLQWQTGPQVSPVQATRVQGQLTGTLAALQTQLQGQVQQGPWSAQMATRVAVSTPWGDAKKELQGWQGQLQQLDLVVKKSGATGDWQMQLPQTVDWRWTPQAASAVWSWGGGTLQLRGPTPGQARVQWAAGEWRTPAAAALAKAPGSVQITVDDVPLAWSRAWGAPEWPGDLTLQARVELKAQEPLALSAVISRSRGDLLLPMEGAGQAMVPAGLRDARAQLQVQGQDVRVTLNWDSEQLGQLSAQGQTQLTDSGQWAATAPIAGQVKASLQRVGAWSLLAPPGWRVKGTLETDFVLSGTRSQPRWLGTLNADQLTVRSAVQGIEFSQGQLRAKLQDQQVDLTELSIHGEGPQGGQLQMQGRLNWLQPQTENATLGQVRVALQMKAQGLRVSNRADRRLAVTGLVDAQLEQGQLKIRGRVQADQALFILPDNSTPTLGSDVVMTERGQVVSITAQPGAQVSATPSWVGVPDVQVVLDLGPDFKVQGQGVNTRLAGALALNSSAATRGMPRLTGDVSTVGGSYKAYGQDLRIEKGLLRFNGVFNNPGLDIVAIRPYLSQRVGVSVGGTAQLPQISLFADPELPDAEKLAWLVLGRSGADGGAESAMLQQAALALLSRDGKGVGTNLAGALGLDEVSLARGSRSDTTATGAAITLGKRLSRDFYVVYESSLSGTFGSLYMFYDLSNRFKLRAQTGDQNALDLIFTVRKD
jgi:translocation and assembly module TamB